MRNEPAVTNSHSKGDCKSAECCNFCFCSGAEGVGVEGLGRRRDKEKVSAEGATSHYLS